MRLHVDPNSIADYRTFLRVKSLPSFRCAGRVLEFPDEYAAMATGFAVEAAKAVSYEPSLFLYDYQAGVSSLAIRKKKFSAFIDCGYGKTLILAEFARHVQRVMGSSRNTLILSPLMVVGQTVAEIEKFYGGELKLERVVAKDLPLWLKKGRGIAISNYDALETNLDRGRLGALVLDESSMLKSHYGKWGQVILRMGGGLEWKLALTGTPAPNDRIEYANHAVFMDAFPTVNAFLAKFFINRGQTSERWELKPHALGAFYRALSHWCIFMSNPATYGWKDNVQNIPPIHVHIHDVDLTAAQQESVFAKTGTLFVDHVGGITKRATLGQIGKGFVDGVDVGSLKPAFIKSLVDSWPEESTIIWCIYNQEQEGLAKLFPDAANINGDTPIERREELIADFKTGRRRVLISKPKILGYGLNLQVCTRQIFSGLQDSYESYYQAVKRSNRVGSTRPLNVHIPITEVERPMVDNVIRKAAMIQRDTDEQERIFRAVNDVNR